MRILCAHSLLSRMYACQSKNAEASCRLDMRMAARRRMFRSRFSSFACSYHSEKAANKSRWVIRFTQFSKILRCRFISRQLLAQHWNAAFIRRFCHANTNRCVLTMFICHSCFSLSTCSFLAWTLSCQS